MKKLTCILLLLLFTSFCLSVSVSAESPSYTYDISEDILYDSDGNTYVWTNTFQFYYSIGELLAEDAGGWYIYSVENEPSRWLRSVSGGLYCDERYVEEMKTKMRNFVPSDHYGLQFEHENHLDAVNRDFVNSLNSTDTVTFYYSDFSDHALSINNCVLSEDGLLFTPVGMFAEIDGAYYYADFRRMEDAHFQYDGIPLISAKAKVQAVKLTKEQWAVITTCENSALDWSAEYYGYYDLENDFHEDSQSPAIDILLLIIGGLLFGALPLAGMILGAIVSCKSRTYRTFGVGSFIFSTLSLAIFCILLTLIL